MYRTRLLSFLHLWLFGLTAPFSITANAEIKMREPLDFGRDMGQLSASIKKIGKEKILQDKWDSTGYTECAEAQDLQGAVICGSFLQQDMGQIFARASTFAEGANLGSSVRSAGEVVGQSDSAYQKKKLLVMGVDLKGEDLLKFFAATLDRCAQGEKDFCLNPSEEAFYSNVLIPITQKRKQSVFISFSLQSFSPFMDVIGHEILHAYYFLNPKFTEIVDKFWNENVTAADRESIRQVLIKIGYKVQTNDYLLRNEFQAYLLQPGKVSSDLVKARDSYREALFEKLGEFELTPVQIQ